MTRRAVLHLDSERTWRGGENQVLMLLSYPAARDWEWHIAAPPDSEAIRRLGAYAQPVPVSMRGARILTAARVIARYVREHEIGLIDCQSSRAHNVGLMVAALVPDLRLVVHRRVDYPPTDSFMSRRKYMSERVNRYVCISNAIARILEEYGIPRDKLAIVHSATDPAPFISLDRAASRERLARELGIADGVPIIGNVAYITIQKGHDTLMRALGELRRSGRRFFCYVAGEGALEQATRAEAASQGLTEADVRFLGVRKDVPELLTAADIFALSSNDEGLGTSLLDATHAGCALVATAVGGIPEVITDGVTGLLSPVRNPEVFAAQLGRVIDDPALRASLVSAARAHAQQHFSVDAMVDGNLRVYSELLAL